MTDLPAFVVWLSDVLGLPEPTYDIYPHLKQFVENIVNESGGGSGDSLDSSPTIDVIREDGTTTLRLAPTALVPGDGISLVYDETTGVFTISSETLPSTVTIASTPSIVATSAPTPTGTQYSLKLGPGSLVAGSNVTLTYDPAVGAYTINAMSTPTVVEADNDTIAVTQAGNTYGVSLAPGALVAGSNTTLVRDPVTGVVTINSAGGGGLPITVSPSTTIDVTQAGTDYTPELAIGAVTAGPGISVAQDNTTRVVTVSSTVTQTTVAPSDTIDVDVVGDTYTPKFAVGSIVAGTGIGIAQDPTTRVVTVSSTATSTVVAPSDTIDVDVVGDTYTPSFALGSIVAGTGVSIAQDPTTRVVTVSSTATPTVVAPSDTIDVDVAGDTYTPKFAVGSIVAGAGVSIAQDPTTRVVTVASTVTQTVVAPSDTIDVDVVGDTYTPSLALGSVVGGTGITVSQDPGTRVVTIDSDITQTVVASSDTIDVVVAGSTYTPSLSTTAIHAGTNVTVSQDPGTREYTINATDTNTVTTVTGTTSVQATPNAIPGGTNYTVQLAPGAIVAGSGINVSQDGAGVATISATAAVLQFWTESRDVAGTTTSFTPTTATDVARIGGSGFTTNPLATNASLGQNATDLSRSVAVGVVTAGGADSSVLGGTSNTIEATAGRAVIGGGQANSIQGASNNGFIGSGALNIVSAANNGGLVAGTSNTVASSNGFIGGGNANNVQSTAINAGIVAGDTNVASGVASFVGGGNGNSAQGLNGGVAAGETNTASGEASFVGGGNGNSASGLNSAVLAGSDSISSGEASFIGAGTSHINASLHGSIAAGTNNETGAGANAFIGGGNTNQVLAAQSGVVGGIFNVVSGTSLSGFIGAGQDNEVTGTNASVVGGNNNSAQGATSFIGGGSSGQALGARCAIVAGSLNIIGNLANDSFIGAGANNTIILPDQGVLTLLDKKDPPPPVEDTAAAILAGKGHTLQGFNSAILSGEQNEIVTTEKCKKPSRSSSVLSGRSNVLTDGQNSAVLYGELNRVHNPSGVSNSTVGGRENVVSSSLSVTVGYKNESHETATGSFISGSFLKNRLPSSVMMGMHGDSSSSTLEHTALMLCSGSIEAPSLGVVIGRDHMQNSSVITDTLHANAPASYYFEKGTSLPDADMGYFITIRDGKAHLAQNLTEVVGVTAPRSGLVHNSQEKEWYGKYDRDEFGLIRTKTSYLDSFLERLTGVTWDDKLLSSAKSHDSVDLVKKMKKLHDLDVDESPLMPREVPVLSPLFDSSLPYVPRSKRTKEWVPVTFQSGPVRVRDNGSCVVGQKCACAAGIAVPADDGFLVMSRISSNVILVLI